MASNRREGQGIGLAVVVVIAVSFRGLLSAHGEPTSASRLTDLVGAPPAKLGSQIKGAVRDGGSAGTQRTTVVAGTPNDFCANATPITGPGPFTYNSSLNTLDGAPACVASGQSQIDRDEWFCWTAPATACPGEFVVSTCGTLVDTKIAVYEGCNCANTAPIACSDDDCGLQTHLPFMATPGAQYLIRIGVYPGEPGGPGSFSITCRPALPCQQPEGHCQIPTTQDALNSSRNTFVVADDFTPAVSGDVTDLCWWGVYLDNQTGGDCQGEATDSFVVKYYANAAGQPGSLLAVYTQSNGTLVVQGPAATGLFLPGNSAEYEVSASHAALPVLAGECYWVEISNGTPGCSWFWEIGVNRNQRAFQDGLTGAPDGYDPEDGVLDDLAFCLNRPLGDSTDCLPSPPANDACAGATPLSTEGEVFFELAGATTDGPSHSACQSSGQSQIAHDAWYCLTAPCSGDIFIRTCGGSQVDTRIAVYNGCTCPVTSANLLACNDDICGDDNGLQSMVVIDAIEGQQYLIRLGTFPSPNTPGGPGFLDITCGPPDHSGCPGTGSCCTTHASAGCSNETCCESVCACDAFCCEVHWDSGCAGDGFGGSGCGANQLCNCQVTCGDPEAGNCCSAHAGPSCSDQACCTLVCACDPYCCTTQWDDACAGSGFNNGGCGAAILCNCGPGVCGNSVVDQGEECDGGACCTPMCTFAAAGSTCRVGAGTCDLAETCDGQSAACPPNAFKEGDLCRDSAGPCDVSEFCNGLGPTCPPNSFNQGSVCRVSVGICDPPEFCSGLAASCPADFTITECGNSDGCCPAGCDAVNDSDCVPVCGNGVVEPGEDCDDGNETEGDGCTVDCMQELQVIPTVNAWGLTTLVLLLLIGMKVRGHALRNGKTDVLNDLAMMPALWWVAWATGPTALGQTHYLEPRDQEGVTVTPSTRPRAIAPVSEVQRIPATSEAANGPNIARVYDNVIDPITNVYTPDAGDRMADDMALAADSCAAVYYEVGVIGFSGGGSPAAFSVELALWDGDPCDFPVSQPIAGTERTIVGIPQDSMPKLIGVPLDSFITIPSAVWMAATFSNDNAGWLIAGQAEVGFTQNTWSEDDLNQGCGLFSFTSGTYGGFYAGIECDLPDPPNGACCDGPSCSQTTEADCTTGIWQGALTPCSPNTCITGTCCSGIAFDACTDATEAGCPDGVFTAGATCADGCSANYKVYENDFRTGLFAGVEANTKFADDLTFAAGTPCDLLAYDMIMFGDQSGPATFAAEIELWTNDDRGSPGDPEDDTPGSPITGTGRLLTGLPADGFAKRLLVSGFSGVSLPPRAWITVDTNVDSAGPALAGLADIGFSEDLFAIFNVGGNGTWTPGFNFGGFDPSGCPGFPPSCVPAGSFRVNVWCAGEDPTGACCSSATGVCSDGVPFSECQGRWVQGVDCAAAAFDPPCGAHACCHRLDSAPDVSVCQDLFPADCLSLDDGFVTFGRSCDDLGECPDANCLGFSGDCFSAHPGTGCADPFCTCEVCAEDNACCSIEWDASCAALAAGLCTLNNDTCQSAQPIAGVGVFSFDNSEATTDGVPHALCDSPPTDQIAKDLWFRWLSPCTSQVFVSTCEGTFVDTVIAVYNEVACLPPAASLLACNDDICARQSMVRFDATAGQEYLLRIGSVVDEQGGEGTFLITCGPPNNVVCPAGGSCCAATGHPGCNDELCCETVCACDPYCCATEWDAACALGGFEDSGCGAAILCNCGPACGNSVVDQGEECDGGACCTPICTFAAAETTCRAVGGACDVAETCDGQSAACPPNAFKEGDLCRDSAGPCDAAEACNGLSATCPPDTLDDGTVCRPSGGPCDPPEFCSGLAASCPADFTITECGNSDGCCPAGCDAVNDSDCVPVCGNGIVEPGEDCDDGNDIAGDGCDVDCTGEVQIIPTVNAWGLAVLALALLVGMKVRSVAVRRRSN